MMTDSVDSLLDKIHLKDDKIYEQNELIKTLRNQITYLQEELALAEDETNKQKEKYELKISELEEQIGSLL